MSKPAIRQTDQQACRQMDNFGNTYIHADIYVHTYIHIQRVGKLCILVQIPF